jgi:hypothetical protein
MISLRIWLACSVRVPSINMKSSSKEGTHFKYLWDQYRVHMKRNPRYECPPMIIEREWNALQDDAMEKML